MTSLDSFTLVSLARSTLNTIRNMSKPVIAVVKGYALGGGLELAMACDIIITSDKSKLGLPEIRIGLIPGAGGTQQLPKLIGEKKAKDLIFTGRYMDAFEAERLGLVSRVVSEEKLDETVSSIVKDLLNKSPLILKFAKMCINYASESGLDNGYKYESSIFSICFSTEDQKEGTRAFIDKRKPFFKGR